VARLRRFLWLREQMRDRSTRVYAAIRRYALEIGRRAAAAGCLRSDSDVFYLTLREIPQCLTPFLQISVQAFRTSDSTPSNRQDAKDAKGSRSAAPAGAAGAAASPAFRSLWSRGRPADPWRVTGEAAPLATLVRRDFGGLARGAKKSSFATLASWRFKASEEIGPLDRVPLQGRVDERRAYEEMYRRFRSPNEVGRRFGPEAADPGGCRLTGIGCSLGVASGPVRVVADPGEAEKFRRGDVLVCPFTDPGWTPILGVAGAVVTDTGGLLSHAAVLCREFGIPAVLNVPGATRRLRDGQMVRVDGERGHVDVL
jgi:phosphohistidine swiveling domain-containing protein